MRYLIVLFMVVSVLVMTTMAHSQQIPMSFISGTLPAAQLPNPSSSTLGGVESLAVVSHKWINTISTLGVPAATQPACADVSDASSFCNSAAASALTGALPAISGASLTSLNASNISSGTLAVARLGEVTFIKSIVASLPTCNAGADGNYRTVTDALLATCAAGTVVLTGGTTYCTVICQNGVGWINP